MTVDELIKLWREYRNVQIDQDKVCSFDDFINWLAIRELEQQAEIIRLREKLDKKPYAEIPNE